MGVMIPNKVARFYGPRCICKFLFSTQAYITLHIQILCF